MLRVEVVAEKWVEKIREKRIYIGKTCKSTIVSLIRYSSAVAKNMISSVLQTSIAGGEGLLAYKQTKEMDGQEEEREEGDSERYEIQQEFKFSRLNISETADLSINETLSRTIITSVTTLLALISIYVLGGEILKGFSLAMIIGVIIGTYSSIFVAAPILRYFKVSYKTMLKEKDEDKILP